MGLVIGLHGAKGSGKDYFYKAAKAAFPDRDIRKIAYADPIKNEVSAIFGLNNEDEYDWFKRTTVEFSVKDNVHNVVSGRQVVREIGMLMRNYDPQQFIEYVEFQIRKSPNAIWCITDVRFLNEVESVKDKLDGKIVKILRPGFTFDGHITETEFPSDMCDVIIHNNGTIDQYQDSVKDTILSMLERN